jgi:NAD(P)-dependent dehydrogenase (short-subunit alcohol dehydrogenase family)
MARMTAAALPLLRRSSAASVVNVCSIAALNGLPLRALYSASKGAVLALTLAMATDHVREGVRVNCVSPGTVSTPFVDRMLAKFDDPVAERAALDARQAIGRMVTPEEVASAIAYLASPLSASTVGTALEVDGGVHNLRVRPL